jgi:hypothetical protein
MAVRHKSYLDIPTVRRKTTASKNLAQLKNVLGDPTLTEEQRTALVGRIKRVNQWAAGSLALSESQNKGQDKGQDKGRTKHRIEISEEVGVSED